ncbi:MAG: hypothetical protein GDA68_12910 [Nitrospira sp. CR2.1]|nr:hypothetical protein [Nitrospira sp. CR2.1]
MASHIDRLPALTRIIHERFCRTRRSFVPQAGGLALSVRPAHRLAGARKHGSTSSSSRGPHDAAWRFRDQPSGIMRAKGMGAGSGLAFLGGFRLFL